MFELVRKSRISDYVARELRQMLLDNLFRAGDRLPTEMEMARRFGVSRATIREALSILELDGLIERRKGGGTFVRRASSAQLMEGILPATKTDEESFMELLEVREALEMKAVELATRRATPKDVANIFNAMADLESHLRHEPDAHPPSYSGSSCGQSPDSASDPRLRGDSRFTGDSEAMVDADIRFHLAIAAACHNEILFKIINSVENTLRHVRGRTLTIPGRLAVCIDEHRQSAEAIGRRDIDAAVRGMALHIRRVTELFHM